MSLTPLSPSHAHPALPSRETRAVCRSAVAGLHGVSRALQCLARRLSTVPPRPPQLANEPVLEFHAEAGAPEGALYVDGQLVAQLPGISRL
jgi:hypothetical protein